LLVSSGVLSGFSGELSVEKVCGRRTNFFSAEKSRASVKQPGFLVCGDVLEKAWNVPGKSIPALRAVQLGK